MSQPQAVLLGRILPLRPHDGLRTENAVALRGDTIAAVGPSADVAGAVPAGTPVLDFHDRTVMPGFVDTHTHAAAGSIGGTTMLNCVDGHESIADIQQTLTDHLGDGTESGWLIARAKLFLDRRLRDDRYPTREDLDKVSRTVPLALQTGHLTMLNSAGLEAIDVERFVGVRHGGMGPIHVQTGPDGRPNGLVNNMDALLPLPVPDRGAAKDAVADGVRRLFTANGVTTLCEMSDTRATMASLTELVDEGRIGSRMDVFLMVPGTMSLDEALDWRRNGISERPGMLDIRGVKMFGDGGYSSSDAAIHSPYCDEVALEPGSTGVLSFSDDELADVLRTLHAVRVQLALHTNGERAQEQLGRVGAKLNLRGGPPIRLEHAGNWMWDPLTPEHWHRGGAVPVPQATFMYTMAAGMPHYLGDYAARPGRLPLRTLFESGWELAGGSDWIWSFEEKITNPLFSVWCCMQREGWDGVVIDPEERLDLETALRMHTANGAKLLGHGDTRGSLEAGRLADIVVLDRDITCVGADGIRDSRVDYVFVGGDLVYVRDGAVPYTERSVR